MSGLLALALKHLALSHGTVPSAVPVGHSMNNWTNGTIGTDGTIGTNGTIGTDRTAGVPPGAFHDRERRCFVCGQPARFGFGVRLLRGLDESIREP
jgi:hypothetical protein